MSASIQTKLLALCILLVLLTTISISSAYYVLTRRDKHRESLQRIQIAFDIILDDLENQRQFYTRKFDEFLQADSALIEPINMYNQDHTQLGSASFLVVHLTRVAESLREFGSEISARQIILYGADKRLLSVYQYHENQEITGIYATSGTNAPTFLLIGGSSQPGVSDGTSQNIWSVYSGKDIPDNPLPSDIEASYEGTIPDSMAINPFSQGQRFGIHIIAPIFRNEDKIGVLTGEILYTQSIVERYASLSKTEVNFFGGSQLSLGTLKAQTQLDPEILEQSVSCEEMRDGKLDIFSVTFEDQKYYQGQCGLQDNQGATIGAITISLSQKIEKDAINKIFTSVLTLSGIVIVVAFILSLIFSRKTVHSIQNIVRVIGAASEGDLRPAAIKVSKDEIGMLAVKLNQMIGQLRTISGQVQNASYAVNSTADTILQQMESLIQHMQKQSTSVDSTVISIEEIKKFIDVVARNTADLLSAAEQILSSIQETRSSIEEVTISTNSLTTNLHMISSSVDQVNQTVKHISENTGKLEEVAKETETEIHHIDQLFKDVSHNANQAQKLAEETMDAATRGQASVDESIQGMTELKEVVSNTAQIIQEVNSWGEQVSSILDIVDEITEQTSLLALNASIISAQAGAHGRGFAVVADEIKELATRTKTSTKEISTLVHELQSKTGEGVNNTKEGLRKADQGMQLANAVKDALTTILERATRSSHRAADTVQVIQQTAASSQAISAQITRITEMVSSIGTALQEEEREIGQVVEAVENISGMSEQVTRASYEQKKAAQEIEKSMGDVAGKFEDISDQTETLQQNANQIVQAMHTIGVITEQILQNATVISGDTVKDLVQQSDVLQKIVNIFKVS
jgi:methyl-accepting chemotaxis protein